MTDRIHLRSGMVAAAVACAAGMIAGTAFGTVIAVAGVVAAALATLAFLRVSAMHGRITRRLRACSTDAVVAGTPLRLGRVGGSVFVAGFARPAIFCDKALLDELDADEIKAVTLHERAHELARDPLRSAGAAVITPLLRPFARGRGWLARRAAAREIAADRYALAHGAERRAIASALVKVPPAGAAHASAFAPAVELRLRALLGDEVSVARRGSWWAITVGAMAGAAACLAIAHPAARVAEILGACCPT